MMHTTGNERHVLDNVNSLASLLDSANIAYGYVEIEFDINSLHFKDDFKPYGVLNISFSPFLEHATTGSKEAKIHN